MTTLNEIVIEAVAKTITPEMIQDKVQKHVDDIIKDALRDALSSYSDTGKLIKKAVADSLRVQDLDLPDYGFMVTQMVKALIQEHCSEMIKGKLAEDMESLLSLAPKTIKLSKIVADMLEDDSSIDEVFFELECENEFGSRWLYLDPHHVRDHRSADVRLLLNKDGKIAAGWLSKKDLKTDKSFGNFYGLEQKIRAYYACGTVIELDENDVITSRYDQ